MNMKKQRVYIDTSVIGGLFDAEFAKYTKLFFKEVIAGQFTIIASDILELELRNAPEKVISFYASIPEEHIERVNQNPESDSLAQKYIQAKVVGKTSLVDCQHIALATLIEADILVSWNFKHIVNI